MPDRYIRDEILDSERWLAVDCNAKLAFVACLLKCDTVGNLDAPPLRLYRLWRDFGAGTVDDSEVLLATLKNVDLVREYVVDKKRFIHIPRFGQSRKYLGRLHPASPWDSEKRETQRSRIQRPSGKTTGEIPENSGKAPEELAENSAGVGVGVGLLRRGVAVPNPSSAREAETPDRSNPVEKEPGKPNGKTEPQAEPTAAECIAELAKTMAAKSRPGHHLTKDEQLAALAELQRQAAKALTAKAGTQ